jgi:hypothetical protein
LLWLIAEREQHHVASTASPLSSFSKVKAIIRPRYHHVPGIQRRSFVSAFLDGSANDLHAPTAAAATSTRSSTMLGRFLAAGSGTRITIIAAAIVFTITGITKGKCLAFHLFSILSFSTA